ncbi:MFS transporter [Marinobacter sp. JB05H06]|uniref:MFS transporter n=1 Tax=Marinobacter TaxID=2742 RepID=UPI0012464B39|nr:MULTISPECIES: MFS transporter [Marinobacter]MBL3557864.1 MFS transporter [Marinobacter sp. JB05H06]
MTLNIHGDLKRGFQVSLIINRRLIAFLVALAAGIVIAAQIGKMPSALPVLRNSFDLSLVQAGWLSASINGAAAVLGLVSGLLAAKTGVGNTLLLGLFAAVVGTVLGALSTTGEMLLGTRLLEGVGFVLIAVSAPSIIAAAATPEWRRRALAIWGCYMPIGVAGMIVLTPMLIATGGWQTVWWVNGGLLVCVLVIAWSMKSAFPKTQPSPAGKQSLLSQLRQSTQLTGHWVMGGAFAIYSSQWFMIGTWLPSFAVSYMEFSLNQAALLTGLVMLANALGNLAAPYLASVGFTRWQVIAAGQVLISGFGFVVFSSDIQPELRMFAAIAASIAGGTIPGTVMAGIPVHARDASEVAFGNGIVVQCINVGILLGPPAIAAVVAEFGGWDTGRWVFPFVGCFGVVLAFVLRRLELVKFGAPPDTKAAS